ncbi:MAG: carboxypeptidase regulatory-like domain-containing protein [Planctomycetes bacterium]|nr:carboxypeptidase regulatory-like domain-containing protein [Planctomycetota bacterium]
MYDSDNAHPGARERGAVRGTLIALCSSAALLLALLVTWYAAPNEGGLREDAEASSPALAPLVADGPPNAASRATESDVRRNSESAAAEAAAPSAPDPDLDLHGLVLDMAGQGIAGARVSAIANPWRRASLLTYERLREKQTRQEALSAADGSFRLRLSRGEVVTLRVEAPGCAHRELAGCQAGERVVVILPPGRILEIRARDEAGDGVAGAKVRFSRRDDLGAFDDRSGETDEDGICRFEAIEEGSGTVVCHHSVLGNAGWQQVQIGSAEITRFELVLPTGHTLHGTVIDAETKLPIAGARVGESWVLARAVTTTSDGRFELPGWSGNGVDDVHVIAEGYGRQSKTVPSEGPIDFQLMRGDVARGRIISTSGAPITGTLVSAVASKHDHEQQHIDTRSATSGADGSFELTSLRRDLPHTLIVLAEGHGRMLLDFDPAPSAAGTIELGDLVLPISRSISGIALDADETPLARALITLRGHNADRGRRRTHTTERAQTLYGDAEERHSDDRGRFRFPDLAPGNYQLALELAGAPEVSQEIVLGSERDVDGVELSLPAGKSLCVRVVDELSSPIAGAELSLQHETAPSAHARTNSAGTCTFRALPEQEMELSVSAPGAYLRPPSQQVIPANQEVLVVLRRLAFLKGEIVDAQGAKLPHIEVEAVPPEGVPLKGASDEHGAFSVKVAHGERYVLRLNGIRRELHEGGYSSKSTRWRGELPNVFAPAVGLVLRASEIAATGFLDVRVEDPDGQPFANAEVWLSGGSAENSKRSDAAGKARFENLLEGPLLVHAEPPPDSAQPYVRSDQIEVALGAQDVVLRLRRSQKIEGQVLRPDGRSASGVRVDVRGGDVLYARVSTDDAGRFRCIVEPAEQYWIDAELSRPGEPLLRGKSEPFAPGAEAITVRLKR